MAPDPATATARPTQASATPLLDVRDLSIRFKGSSANAVDRVSFAIERGKTLCLVGESGCGKSVTALAAMGLLAMPPGEIVSGTAMFDGRDLLSLPRTAMEEIRGDRMAMIFQEPMTSLNPVFTVGDQVAEAVRRHRPVSPAEAMDRALEMFRRVRIPAPEKRLKDYPHQLSGGMRQRVMIAMALANDPALLIADEPTTALDVTIQAQILDLMRQLQADTGAALLLITHDLGVVAEIADQVAVMYAGRIVEAGPVDAVFADPQHPYTIGLMGSVPSLAGGRERLMTIPGTVPPVDRLPPGCRFATRCPFADDVCTAAVPAPVPAGVAAPVPPTLPAGAEPSDGHRVACFKAPLEAHIEAHIDGPRVDRREAVA